MTERIYLTTDPRSLQIAGQPPPQRAPGQCFNYACDTPASIAVRYGCAHEHVATGWACQECWDRAAVAEKYCLYCAFTLGDSHNCRVIFEKYQP